MIDSPCNKVCAIDARGVCLGCHRTLGEIAAWPDASDAEKAAILQSIQNRHSREGGNPPSQERQR